MSSRWHPTYKRIVLERGFENHRKHFFSSMLQISMAHVLMLVRQRIIDVENGRRLLAALKQLREAGPDAVAYDDRFEDLFFVLEHRLSEAVGDEAVGNLHVALSRKLASPDRRKFHLAPASSRAPKAEEASGE